MTGQVVLDTSVIVRWFRQEEVAAQGALAYRAAYLNGEVSIVLPTLVLYELSNVLRYKKDLTTDQVAGAIESLLDMDLDWVDPNSSLIARAVRIARQCNTSVYDAICVALAQILSAPFVTADARLARRIEGEGMVRVLQ